MGTNYIAPIWRMPRNANNTPVDKLSNYSIYFDGSDYINCGNDDVLNVSTSNYSFSIWVKYTTTANRVVMEKKANNQLCLQLGGTGFNGYITWVGGPDYLLRSAGPMNDGQWHHICCVADGNSSTYYIDGQINATGGSKIFASNNTNDLHIGSRGGSIGIIGEMNQLCIFNYALDFSQVTYLYNLNNPMAITGGEPVAYYPLGDNSNPNAPGSFPNISVGADSVFDFADDNIKVDNIGSLFSGITNFSFSGWFNLTSFSGQQVFNILEGNSSKFGINTFNNQLRFNVYPGVAYIANLQNITSTNTWFHYAGVFDGSGASDTDRLKLYINGQPQTVTYNTTTPTSFSTLLSTAHIFIGGSVSPFNGMTGKASNIQLWTSSLIPSQIQTLYNNGQPLMTGTQPQEANLKAWYKLDQSANWEADSSGAWQIPDAVSAYPQSFDFENTGEIIIPEFSLSSEFSIGVWLNADSFTAGSALILGYNANNSYKIEFNGSTVVLIKNFPHANITYSGASWNLNEWQHLLITRDSSDNLKIYRNGEYWGGGSHPGTFLFDRISGFKNSVRHFDGNLSNFQRWDTELSSSQIETLYNNGVPLTTAIASDNLKAWYKLDNTATFSTNWSVPDASGNGNTGTSSGMTEQNLVNNNVSALNGESVGMDTTNLVTSNISRTQPYSNYSFNFDGSLDYVNISSAIDVTGDKSFSLWIKRNTGAASNDGGILTIVPSGGTSDYISIALWQDNIQVQVSNSASTRRRSTDSITTNIWHHIVVIKSNNSIDNIYINAVNKTLDVNGSWSGTIDTPQSKIGEAIFSGNNYNFNGKISNVCIFDRVISEQEVLKIYNNGVPQDLQATSSFSNNILAWWPLDEHSSYYDGTDWVVRDLINGNDGQGANTGNVDDLVGNAPGSEASGTGSNLAISDLKGNMSSSDKNAYSINMADYADGVINPANSGRSTDVP